jgi:iron-sulfur cluster repair protein YtfE (RIC family)
MATSNRPGTDAARHGVGDADIRMMIVAHDAFRRDLTKMARAATPANLRDPGKRESINNGWEIFKHQLHLHHSGEDDFLWPSMRKNMGSSEFAMSTLDAMEAEHERIDPLLATVETSFADETSDEHLLSGAIDELTTTLLAHLGHEERDTLPMIGEALSAKEWKGVMGEMRKQVGLAGGAEFFPWLLDGAPQEREEAMLANMPGPGRMLYRRSWKPKYEKTSHW